MKRKGSLAIRIYLRVYLFNVWEAETAARRRCVLDLRAWPLNAPYVKKNYLHLFSFYLLNIFSDAKIEDHKYSNTFHCSKKCFPSSLWIILDWKKHLKNAQGAGTELIFIRFPSSVDTATSIRHQKAKCFAIFLRRYFLSKFVLLSMMQKS